MSKHTVPLILASRSPRRADLLKRMGFSFQVIPGEVVEGLDETLRPEEQVIRLSSRKAEAVLSRFKQGIVIGADTIVVLEDQVIGKPLNNLDARRMLLALSGKTHKVYTGFTLIQIGGRRFSDVEETSVQFRDLKQWEIDAYIETGGPLDKAGGYGIQDQSGLFVERIEGCFYNVVGFPLTKFYQGLKSLLDSETIRRMMFH
jgi:septum formation protein